MCCVCGCYQWGIVVMDVIYPRLMLFELGKGATSEAVKYFLQS